MTRDSQLICGVQTSERVIANAVVNLQAMFGLPDSSPAVMAVAGGRYGSARAPHVPAVAAYNGRPHCRKGSPGVSANHTGALSRTETGIDTGFPVIWLHASTAPSKLSYAL